MIYIVDNEPLIFFLFIFVNFDKTVHCLVHVYHSI